VNVSAKKRPLPRWLPIVLGSLLVVQFAGLGVWQINRGLEKRATSQAFDAQSGFAQWSNGMEIRAYQKLQATGRFDTEHQFLLDNIIINSRYGYYVITPLLIAEDEPLLLVNRGWLEKTAQEFDPERIALAPLDLTVRGRAGSLPKAAYRMGDPIGPESVWPHHAVYPALLELAAALDREVQPFVLLLDPDEKRGYLRNWEPAEMGPAQHFGYAFQWFAMAAALGALLAWHSFKRRATRG
jgi:surfeit locus 1 family protein